MKPKKRVRKAARMIRDYLNECEVNQEQIDMLLSTLEILEDRKIPQEEVKVYWRHTDDDDVNWYNVSVSAPFMAGV